MFRALFSLTPQGFHGNHCVLQRPQFEVLAAQGADSANVSLVDYKKSLSGAIAGTPEQCFQQLSRYVDDGIHYFFLLFPDPISNESLDLFANEVMPHFA